LAYHQQHYELRNCSLHPEALYHIPALSLPLGTRVKCEVRRATIKDYCRCSYEEGKRGTLWPGEGDTWGRSLNKKKFSSEL
jgi:hypothetical protein